MTLIERYLKAVAAQLPTAGREGIVAELREALTSRVEARQEELGRPLTDAEMESMLRETGHPLTVAARYGAGPQHVVGPELYPWWLFGVKTALTVLVLITGVGVAARILIGEAEAGQAIGQAFASLFSGGLTVVGAATAAAFIIERQDKKPAFLTEWRVKDLGLFEVGLWNGWGEMSRPAPPDGAWAARGRSGAVMSPTARAIGSAAGWAVFLLWWTGLLGAGLSPHDLRGDVVRDGVDWGGLIADTLTLAYWPVTVFAAARAAFHLVRAAAGAPARLTAFGDLVFRMISLGFVLWFWFRSPFSPGIAIASVGEFVARMRALVDGGELHGVLTLIAALATLGEAAGVLRALQRLVFGR